MTLREMIIEDARQEGREEGRELGFLDSLQAQKMLKAGKSPGEIAKFFKVKESTILEMKKILEDMD